MHIHTYVMYMPLIIRINHRTKGKEQTRSSDFFDVMLVCHHFHTQANQNFPTSWIILITQNYNSSSINKIHTSALYRRDTKFTLNCLVEGETSNYS